jgi:hypothetical protein
MFEEATQPKGEELATSYPGWRGFWYFTPASPSYRGFYGIDGLN